MEMHEWILSAVCALFFWGIAAFVPKLAVAEIGPHNLLFFQIVGTALMAVPLFAYLGPRGAAFSGGALVGILTGIASICGSLFYLVAINKGRVSAVISIAALYPVVTILLAFVILREPMTLKQLCGMAMSLGAILLIAL